MLNFNGKKFARNNAEFVSSLFGNDGTCIGFYRQIKSGFQLFNLQNELIAFLSPDRGLIVSAHKYNGRARYMFSTCTTVEKYLELPESYAETIKACESAYIS